VYQNIALLSTFPPITTTRTLIESRNGNTLRNGVHRAIAVQITSLLHTIIRAMLNHREETPIDILLEIQARNVHFLMALVVIHTAGLPVMETVGHLQPIGIGLQSRVNPPTLHRHPATHSTRRPIRTRPILLILFARGLHLEPLMYHDSHHHHLNAQSRHLHKASNPQRIFTLYLVLVELPQPLISRKRTVL